MSRCLDLDDIEKACICSIAMAGYVVYVGGYSRIKRVGAIISSFSKLLCISDDGFTHLPMCFLFPLAF